MSMDTDGQLLARYLDEADQAAFAEMIRRHGGFVYATARRTVASHSADADDVTQATFLLLHRKAAALRGYVSVAGWLHRTAINCGRNARKIAARRQKHENAAARRSHHEALMRHDSSATDHGPLDERLRATLDDALAALPDDTRAAVMLRYLQARSVDETAALLNVSPAAAGKRATRGLERLRELLTAKGVTVTTATLTAALAAEAATAAPAATIALAATGKTTAAAQTLASTALPAVAAKVIAVAIAVMLFGAGAAVWQSFRQAAPPPAAAAAVVTLAPPAPAASPVLPAVFTPQEEAAVAGTTTFAYTSTLVDFDALRPLDAALEPTGTDFRVGPAKAVFETLRAARAEKRTRGEDHYVRFQSAGWRADRADGNWVAVLLDSLYEDVNVGPHLFTTSLGFSGRDHATGRRRDDGRIDVRFEDAAARLFIQEYSIEPRALRESTVALNGSATLAAGEAAVMVVDLGEMRDQHFAYVIFVHAFNVTQDQRVGLHSFQSFADWLTFGPEGARKAIDRAARWGAGRKVATDDVPARWTQTLDNGAIVRLAAVCQPKIWPMCWWDADGNAVSDQWTNWPVDFRTSQAVVCEIVQPKEHPDRKTGEAKSFALPDGDDRVELWVANGDEHEQRIAVGDEVKLGDGFVHFTKALDSGGPVLAVIDGSLGPDYVVYVDAVLKSGKRVPQSNRDHSLLLVTSAYERWTHDSPNLQVGDEEIDHFVLCWQQREQALFTGFAATPTIEPEKP